MATFVGKRPLAYDVTHLVSRLNRLATTGIDRVDLCYARHFAGNNALACGLHYSLGAPHRFSPARVARLVASFEAKLLEREDDSPSGAWPELLSWLTGAESDPSDPAVTNRKKDRRRPGEDFVTYLKQCALRITHDFSTQLPVGSIYLNVAQSAFEFPVFFKWLDDRPDILPVFLVHDFLPLDYPEYFRSGYQERFNRRVETIIRHARAIIVTSSPVRDRVLDEYARRRRKAPPIHVQHLPSPLGDGRVDDDELPALAKHPYFVLISTIEPRKNHLLLLNVWRQLGQSAPSAPKLVLVGAPGWENEQTKNMLERSSALQPLVRNVNGLSRKEMRMLIANARAVLMPSFAEGYGLPVVEALSLGAPAIVSDLPVFQEVTQGAATFLSPIDGVGWLNAIRSFSEAQSPVRMDAALRAQGFVRPEWSGYFASVIRFIAGL